MTLNEMETAMFHVAKFLTLLHVSLVYVVCSTSSCLCDDPDWEGEDNWAHYKSGGMFITDSPSLSPDGQSIVFASACTGHGDIYLMKSGEDEPVRLTESEDFESWPAFTPDGKRIFYTREHNKRRHIWMMNVDGSRMTQVTRGETLDDPLCLSRDGQHMLFDRTTVPENMMYAFVMRVGKHAGDPECVGDFAVFTGDSQSVIYADDEGLWRRELNGEDNTPRRIDATGWPLDASDDGGLVLVARVSSETATNINCELWVLDLEGGNETKVADGHSALFFGTKSQNILFYAGFREGPYVTTIRGGKPTRIKCASTNKTAPRLCLNGRGVEFGSFSNSGPNYDAIFIDLETLHATTVASITCSGVTFRPPSVK